MLRSSNTPAQAETSQATAENSILMQKVQGVLQQLVKFLFMALLLPVLLVVRLLRPVFLVRFGPLRTDRIGDFTFHTEVYLCSRDLGLHGRRALDLFYCRSRTSNHFLKKMWQRTIHIYPVADWLDRLNRWVPGGKVHEIPISQKPYQNRDMNGVLAKVGPHLSFTSEEEAQGQAELQEIGIPPETPFVCFIARDSAYLDQVFPQIEWSYQGYRDASIQSYVQAAEELAGRGYYSLRMGAAVEEKLDSTNPLVIDYANTCRTEFLDMYLGSRCKFLITNDCGYVNIPQIFRRPIVWTNMSAMEVVHTWLPNQIFILKKLWHEEERRFLTFPEIMSSGIGRLQGSDNYQELGITLIENTPEEISVVALEMDDRLNGTWNETEEDDHLQRRFWELYASSEQHNQIVSRIGADFLRQNQDLLD